MAGSAVGVVNGWDLDRSGARHEPPVASAPMTSTSDDATVTTVADLEAAVGERTPAGAYKSIAILDEHCRALLARSPLSFLGFERADGTLGTSLVGGAPGHAEPTGPTELALGSLADRSELVHGAPAGLLSVVPGYGETLRVNGRLSLDGSAPVLVVEEAFVHCAKAIIRSKLWSAEPVDEQPWAAAEPIDGGATEGGAACLELPAVRAFLAASPFCTLASVDDEGGADVSPKGDPVGFVHVLDGGRLAVPDRPGNLRTDTLHNLMDRPQLDLVALVPGSSYVLEVSGTASVTVDEGLRAALEVNAKVPLAAIVLDVERVVLRPDPAIDAAALWDTGRHIEPGTLPRASQMWSDHVQLHAGLGTGDDDERLVPVDGLHEGIEQNYRDGLY